MSVQLATTVSITLPREEAIRQFLKKAGWEDAKQAPLKGDASFRRYIRLHRGEETAMLMDAPPARENVRPYVAVARFLCDLGYSTPRILAEDTENGFVLSEDLGDDLYTRLLAAEGSAVDEKELYQSAINLLADWHNNPAMARLEAQKSLNLPEYNLRELMREVGILSDWFLPELAEGEKLERLKDSFTELWHDILCDAALPADYFVHRDFHADNLIWRPERAKTSRVGLLDFQDGIWGHPAYDLVSLLEDARRDVAPDLAEELKQSFLSQTSLEKEAFERAYSLLGAQRNCKIIGIFVRLSRRDNKHGYLAFLPRVWGYLQRDMEHPKLNKVKEWMDANVPPAYRGELKKP